MSFGPPNPRSLDPIYAPLAFLRLRTALRPLVDLICYWQRRAAVARLARLDEHMLRDIGLTWSDVRDATVQPFPRDPTELLSARRAARRAGSRPAPGRIVGSIGPKRLPYY